MIRKPRVGLNALFFDPGVSGGSETYLRNLLPELVRAHPETHFELATSRRGAAAIEHEDWSGEITTFALPSDDDEPVRRTVVEQIALPRLARRRGWDLMHSLSNRGPRVPGCSAVVTVHDVLFFEHRTMSAVSTAGMRWAVRAAVAGSDTVIAVSESAADDIASTLEIERERVVAVPHGPGRSPADAAPAAGVRARHGLRDGRVVLCVAAKRPHKNQLLLVEALEQLPPDVSIVLVGHDEGYGETLRAEAQARGLSERVVTLDYVPDDELEALWDLASCAAFPTLAEGFGLPVLEAMRRAVPVACSDLPVLREVAGEAARYFDPRDPAEAAGAIAAAIDDEQLAEAGCERARSFTWERAADETYAVYARVGELG